MNTVLPPPDWLSPVADVLSIIGFAVTIWVLAVTRSLRRTFALRARTPALRRSLSGIAKVLPGLLSNWPATKNETLGVLANGRAILENLVAKLPRGERTNITRLISRLRGKRKGLLGYKAVADYTEEEFWSIFAELQGVIASLEQREKDATWE